MENMEIEKEPTLSEAEMKIQILKDLEFIETSITKALLTIATIKRYIEIIKTRPIKIRPGAVEAINALNESYPSGSQKKLTEQLEVQETVLTQLTETQKFFQSILNPK